MENLKAKEYFERAQSMAKALDAINQELAEVESGDTLQAVRYDTQGGCSSDGFGKIAQHLATSSKLEAKAEECKKVLDDALIVLYGSDGRSGIAKAMDSLHADVVCAHYLQLESWRKIAKGLGCSHVWAQMVARETFKYLDEHIILM